jgi:hypothetical protein
MTNTTLPAVGQIVRYANPMPGEETERFTVLELRGERVLLGMLGFESWPIPPTCARLASELVAVSRLEALHATATVPSYEVRQALREKTLAVGRSDE